MTSPTPQGTDATQTQTGFCNGQWIAARDLSISMSDLGFRQGVVAVERFRTYGQQIFQRDAHLARWRSTIDTLGIAGLPSAAMIANLLDELIQRNQSTVSQWQETGITMVATPGAIGDRQPTFAIHLNQLDLEGSRQRQASGQRLVITDVVQPPPQSWSRQIKVRCRLHYYLADRVAQTLDTDARGVLIDHDQTITETSIANVAIVQAGQVISPPPDRVLAGITQTVVQRLASVQQIGWCHRPITIDQLTHADEVLLMGTDGGLWFSHLIDQRPIADGQPGKIYQRLKAAFDRLVSS